MISTVCPPLDAPSVLTGLDLEHAPDDLTRVKLLRALIAYGQARGDTALVELAQNLRPAADPIHPPNEWADHYHLGFGDHADENRGTYAENSIEYVTDYWQMLSDEQRRDRLANPLLGLHDGQRDAEGMNRAG